MPVSSTRCLGQFGAQTGGQKLLYFDTCFVYFWVHFSSTVWTTCWFLLGPFWVPISGPYRCRGALKSFKVPKNCILKNLKNTLFVFKFLGSKAAQDSLGRPTQAPERHLNSSKTSKKGSKTGPNAYTFLLQFCFFGGAQQLPKTVSTK